MPPVPDVSQTRPPAAASSIRLRYRSFGICQGNGSSELFFVRTKFILGTRAEDIELVDAGALEPVGAGAFFDVQFQVPPAGAFRQRTFDHGGGVTGKAVELFVFFFPSSLT